MGILGWLVLGLLAGAIAREILPGDDPGDVVLTMFIGIAGAIVGGLIATALGIGDVDVFFDAGTWVMASLGSIALLLVCRAPAKRREPADPGAWAEERSRQTPPS